MLPNAQLWSTADFRHILKYRLAHVHIYRELIFYYTYLFSVLLITLQTCQLSRFPRETPALEALVYFPHDF